MATNFKINGSDFSDVFIPRDLFAQGGLWDWGRNLYGQLGDGAFGTGNDRSTPVQTVAGGTNWKQVACGSYHTTAIKTDGTLWGWGYNSNAPNLGDNTNIDRPSPVQTVAAGTNWKQVACGSNFTAAVKSDGTLWLWGENGYGQLGNGDSFWKSSPVQTWAGGTNWKQVSTGYSHVASIKTDGTLWLWGKGSDGALGNNASTTSRLSPVQTVSGGTNWKLVSSGGYHTAAIKTDGTLWTWGSNVYGQLGDNTVVGRSSPVQTVSGGTNWKYVASGLRHTTAIKTDGTLWLWGFNQYGQLGDNTRTSRSSPVQTVAGGTNWKQASGAWHHTAAIKIDGTLWTWGNNFYGGLGDNTTTSRSSPVQTVSGGTNWKQVATGAWHSAAITDIY